MRLGAYVFSIMLMGTCFYAAAGVAAGQADSASNTKFEGALRRFGVDHDRKALRDECNRASSADSRYALPIFYLGVLDEADEKWILAQRHFNQFLALEKDSDLSAQARKELKKLPFLIKEDLTLAGKRNRQYRQHLGYADLLQRRGFSREAFLEAAEASKLLPNRWEAYAVASSIMLSQHDLTEANHFLELASKNVPADSAQKLNSLSEQIKRQSLAKGTPSAQP